MKRVVVVICSCLMIFLSVGCSFEPKEDVTDINKSKVEILETSYDKISDVNYKKLLVGEGKQPDGISFEDYDKVWKIREDNPVKDSTYKAISKFSYETAAKFLKYNEDNILYSPVSLYYALALATVGAKDTTQEELLDFLNIPSASELAKECGNLYRILHKDNELSKLRIGNSLWLDHEVNGEVVKYNQDYMDIASKEYYASLFSVDFADPMTSSAMSKWIEEQTNGTLQYRQDPSTEQMLSIINTIYFYGEWNNKFDESSTKDGKFKTAQGDKVKCDFMNSNKQAGFSVGEGYIRSSLELKENSRMVFILPDKGMSIEKLLSSPGKIEEIFSKGEDYYGEVIWKIPKFSYDVSLELTDGLKELGVGDAFTMKANFKGITDNPTFISQIKQDAHIGIDENGVEASAFTQILYMGAALPNGKAEMILDRPFIYGIFSGDLPLFIGVCNNPGV